MTRQPNGSRDNRAADHVRSVTERRGTMPSDGFDPRRSPRNPAETEVWKAHAEAAVRCRIPMCTGSWSQRFHYPLCDEHILRIWATVQGEQDAILERDAAKLIGQRRAASRDERMSQPGEIYYIRIGEHIKVGYAKNLDNRLTAYPPTATLLATHPGTRKDEQAIHSLFIVYLAAGREWYDPSPELMAHIKRVIAEHGAPQIDPFTKRRVQPPKPPPVQARRRSGPMGWRVA